eukprot:951658-Prorocentrum_lima.AAC.1
MKYMRVDDDVPKHIFPYLRQQKRVLSVTKGVMPYDATTPNLPSPSFPPTSSLPCRTLHSLSC